MWDHDGSLSAIVDGENANFVEASRLLDRASQVEMVEEVSLPTPLRLLSGTLWPTSCTGRWAVWARPGLEVLGRTVTCFRGRNHAFSSDWRSSKVRMRRCARSCWPRCWNCMA